MRRFIFAAGLTVAVSICTQAIAADTARMEALGTCLAFSFVNGGLDGMKDVPPDMLPGIMALKEEFLFEASINNLDDNAAQTYVVEQLTEQNRIKELSGLDAVREKHLSMCSRVVEGMIEAKPADGRT